MDPQTINTQQQGRSSSGSISDFQSNFLSPNTDAQVCNSKPVQNSADSTSDVNIQEPLSPFGSMEWIDSNSNSHYLEDIDNHGRPPLDAGVNGFMYNGDDLGWLSDAMHMDGPPKSTHSYDNINSSSGTLSSDPVLSPKPPDLMNIFDLDESDFRVATESSSDLNWDKLISQTSHHL